MSDTAALPDGVLVAGMVVAAGLAAGAVLGRTVRGRAYAMLGALVLTPVLLMGEIWHAPQLDTARAHPADITTAEAPNLIYNAAFDAFVKTSSTVTCPGNIQSPGPWRRNATPDKVSGTLFCADSGDNPMIAWTNQDESLLSTVKSGPQGPNLVALYAWWSSHS